MAPPAAASQPSAPAELTAEAVQTRLQQVAEATDLNEQTKAQVLELYQKALEQLRLASEGATKKAAFDRAAGDGTGSAASLRRGQEPSGGICSGGVNGG